MLKFRIGMYALDPNAAVPPSQSQIPATQVGIHIHPARPCAAPHCGGGLLKSVKPGLLLTMPKSSSS